MQFHCCARGFVLEPRRPDGLAGKNTAFRKKKALLEESGVCIWRYHDYVHAGIRVDGALHDGIFYGLSSLLGWNEYQTDKNALLCHDFACQEPGLCRKWHLF